MKHIIISLFVSCNCLESFICGVACSAIMLHVNSLSYTTPVPCMLLTTCAHAGATPGMPLLAVLTWYGSTPSACFAPASLLSCSAATTAGAHHAAPAVLQHAEPALLHRHLSCCLAQPAADCMSALTRSISSVSPTTNFSPKCTHPRQSRPAQHRRPCHPAQL
ncbi:hypothetical protein COO60DRAFT_388927 [Scenedesmus sp. NREL 46B-D3]|nr:hypothetical protein COO60DRAFT_388927 [Scenedesmus sp. NREL 46B-D3]